VGGVATVTLVLENDGTQPVTVDNPESNPGLVVYDSDFNYLGSWAQLQNAQQMNPPPGPLVLQAGERHSWTFRWDLSLTAAGGLVGGLPLGQYFVEAYIQVGSGVPASYSPFTSNAVGITIA